MRAGVNLTVPLFQGGLVRNSVNAAERRVLAAREGLRGTESDLFTDVVSVYMDVIRDKSIVQLNQQNVRVLEVNLQATQDRFEVGDLTRTDVAQSEARLAIARGQLRSAEAGLIASRENYVRLVGDAPGTLQPPPPLPNLPAAPEPAVEVALAENPQSGRRAPLGRSGALRRRGRPFEPVAAHLRGRRRQLHQLSGVARVTIPAPISGSPAPPPPPACH